MTYTITIYPLQLVLVLSGLAVFSLFYNDVFVENLAEHLLPKWRPTSFEVAFGVFVTCVGIGMVLGLPGMLVCLLCFAASGTRMIQGDVKRTKVLG